MADIDYFAVLGVSQNATDDQIKEAYDVRLDAVESLEEMQLIIEAYRELGNRYTRARLEIPQNYGVLISLPGEKPPATLNTVSYILNATLPFRALKNLIQTYRQWVEDVYDLDWVDAQITGYHFDLSIHNQQPYLRFNFPIEADVKKFSDLLLEKRLIKKPAGSAQ